MIIQSSNLNMNATRSYSSNRSVGESKIIQNGVGNFQMSMYQSFGENLFEKDSNGMKGNHEEESAVKNEKKVERDLLSNFTTRRAEKLDQLRANADKQSIRHQILTHLLKSLFGEDEDFYNRLMESLGLTEGSTTGEYYEYHYSEEYYEQEFTQVSTTGTVVTADGREINFNIHVDMSRSFSSIYEEHIQAGSYMAIDPLVINTSSMVTSVEDQTFYFDLDCDGELDELSTLSYGNGFLALDKNEDGTINDGSELFGALTGDGFAELAQYDMDHNGWIDEADEIFSKLKIWYADGSSEPKLLTLKEAGVGAIALSSVNSNFALTDNQNQANAYIRKTGMFLYENGSAGTIQHVDMVKKGA